MAKRRPQNRGRQQNRGVRADTGKQVALARNPNGAMIPVADVINALTRNALNQGGWSSAPMPRDPYDTVPFGPQSALHPQAINPPRRDTGRPEPRVEDYPPSWNLPGAERHIPWDVLSDASERVDILRRCMQVRKKHVRGMEWAWKVSKRSVEIAHQQDRRRGHDDIEADLRDRLMADINRLTAFWENPWKQRFKSAGPWWNLALEYYMRYDAITVYPQMNYGGDVLALKLINSTTIKPLLDENGDVPLAPFPAYQQVLYGFPRGEWRASGQQLGDQLVIDDAYYPDELYYSVENPRPSSPYGYSDVEMALISARLYLKRQGWLLAEYDDGSTPQTWLVPQEGNLEASELNFRQRRMWEDALNDELTGNTRGRNRVKLTPPGFEPHQMTQIDERYRPDYDYYLVRILAAHMGVSLPEINIVEPGGLGSTGYHEGAEDVQDRVGRRPDTKVLSELVVNLSRQFLHAPVELEFSWLGLESEDEAAQDAIVSQQYRDGRITLNEARRKRGDPLLDFAEADKPALVSDRGIVYIEGAADLAPAGELITPPTAPEELVPGDGPQPPGANGGPAPAGKPAAGPAKPKPAADAKPQPVKAKAAEPTGGAVQPDSDSEIAAYRWWLKKRGGRPSGERPFQFEHTTALQALSKGVLVFEDIGVTAVFRKAGDSDDPKAAPATVNGPGGSST